VGPHTNLHGYRGHRRRNSRTSEDREAQPVTKDNLNQHDVQGSALRARQNFDCTRMGKSKLREGQVGDFWPSKKPGRNSPDDAWCLTYVDKKKRVVKHKSLGTTDFKAACLLVAQHALIETKLDKAVAEDVPVTMILERYWEKHAKHLPSAQAAKYAKAAWDEFFEDKTMSQLSVAVFEEFKSFIVKKAEGPLKSSSIDRTLAFGNAIGVQGDIANLDDLDRLYERIASEKGRLDILFANAGGGEFMPLGAITETHFDKTFHTNVRGTLFTVQKALPLMPKSSSIVLNASITAVKGLPAFSVYSASKAALRSFARGWAVDLKARGIRVNVISPGTVPTHGYDAFNFTAQQLEEFIAEQSAATPLGRVGTPEEIAAAVLFLASSDSSYVNASELFVDGGFAQI